MTIAKNIATSPMTSPPLNHAGTEQVMAIAVGSSNPDLPFVQYGGPYCTAFAAIIAASVAAYVALRGIKANRNNLIDQLSLQRELAAMSSRASVVSTNRQRWINDLREDLAEFITADYALLDDTKVDEGELTQRELDRQKERAASAWQRRRLMYRRIQLRLNPDKPSHKELWSAIRAVMPATGTEHRKAIGALISISRRLLRAEWLRVKAEATGSDAPSEAPSGSTDSMEVSRTGIEQ